MILAIDQGTTGTTCLVVDGELVVRGRGYRELAQSYPRPGWVEHDPEAIWVGVVEAAGQAVAAAGIAATDLRAIGITNQRETTLLWDRRTGDPVHPAIVWQDRRTADACRRLPAELIRERTGLVCDPYFSATKLRWLLDRAGDRGDLAFGTVDSWLVWKLTRGQVHVTDRTNASRTMLYRLDRDEWDDELLELFGVDRGLLPDVRPSCGVLAEGELLGAPLPIAGIAGDQQAALFGQACLAVGDAKVTYGTGCFVLVNQGGDQSPAPDGLLKTAAAQTGVFALEGAVLAAGSVVQWLRDGLGIIAEASETESLARSVESSLGVHVVPAFAGLGSPFWDADARGLITGITAGAGRAHLVRASLEGIAHRVTDVIEACRVAPSVLRADGGAAANGFLLQTQADLLGVPVEASAEREMTAIGAAALAGLGVGLWPDTDALARAWRCGRRFEPGISRDRAAELRAGWNAALAGARG